MFFPYDIHYKCAWVLPFYASLSSEQTKSISRYFPQAFFLLHMQGTETIEALIFNLQRTGRGSFSTNTFQDMKKLRLLQLDRVDLTGDFGYLSKQLRWVNWQRSTFNFVPNDFDQENLVAFELKYSNVKQVWKETKV